jgi:Lar family restriction alleviation protein
MNDGARRTVAKDHLASGVRVSTVFIGLDHQFGEGPPLLFETMIVGGPHDGYQNRCSTWDEAVAMHAMTVQLHARLPCPFCGGPSAFAEEDGYHSLVCEGCNATVGNGYKSEGEAVAAWNRRPSAHDEVAGGC